MWQILVLLVAGSCYSSGEVYNVNVVELPKEATELPAGPAVPATDGTRIVGGFPALIEQFPYAVQIIGTVSGATLQCGGSLISLRHVLSAAHCFVDPGNVMFSPSIFTVRVGATNFNAGGTTHRVTRIINHERYNVGVPRDNDVAVLVLANNVTLSSRVALAGIPTPTSFIPDNVPVTVVGWGHQYEGAFLPSPVLQQVTVYTINTYTCSELYRPLGLPVTNNMLCSGMLNQGGYDSCQGDSGGPVIYGNVVVGVTSWGQGCARPQYPAVNARLTSYTNWILDTVERNDAPSLGQTSVCLLLLSCLISTIFQ